MARFRYRMQNILDIKEKLESQEKAAYGLAAAALEEEQAKLSVLLRKKMDLDVQLKKLNTGHLDIKEINHCKNYINTTKSLIRDQMVKVHTAQRNLENARKRLEAVRKDRKTHENLKEKAFEEFKLELAAEERLAVDELVSFTYHNGQLEEEAYGG